jgi:hypothetical protein
MRAQHWNRHRSKAYIQSFTADAAGGKLEARPRAAGTRFTFYVCRRWSRVHGVARGVCVLVLNHAHSRRLAADSPTKSGTRRLDASATRSELLEARRPAWRQNIVKAVGRASWRHGAVEARPPRGTPGFGPVPSRLLDHAVGNAAHAPIKCLTCAAWLAGDGSCFGGARLQRRKPLLHNPAGTPR